MALWSCFNHETAIKLFSSDLLVQFSQSSLLSLFMWRICHHTWLCCCTRWQCLSSKEHSDHEKRVAYRGMLEAVVSHGKNLPRRALRRLKVTSIEDYAKAVATNLNGKNVFQWLLSSATKIRLIYFCSSDPQVERLLLSYYPAHESFIKLIEPFTVSKTL